jgi:hypothetical protein
MAATPYAGAAYREGRMMMAEEKDLELEAEQHIPERYDRSSTASGTGSIR